MRTLATLLMALTVSGCGFLHNLRRLPSPTSYVAPPDVPTLAAVEVIRADGEAAPYAPVPLGDGLARPMQLSGEDTLAITPAAEALTVRVLLRGHGIGGEDFFEVHALTGARPFALADEIRYLPRTLSSPWRLPVSDLQNVYSGYRLDNDDLILIELSDGEAVERLLFVNREVGWHARLALDALVRAPLLPGDAGREFSPALTAGLALGYRPAERDRGLARAADQLAVQVSAGIGTSALDEARAQEALDASVSQALYSALVGGGVRVLDVLSVQALVNVSGLTDRAVPATWTVGAGVDAARLTTLTRDIGARLLKPNTLSEPPPPETR